MKSLLLPVSAALRVASVAYAQQVLAAAKATFQATFPTGEAVTWGKEGLGLEAVCKQQGKSMSVVITPTGELQEAETALAAAVRAALVRDYQEAYKVDEAATTVRADGTAVHKAEVSRGGRKQKVLFMAG